MFPSERGKRDRLSVTIPVAQRRHVAATVVPVSLRHTSQYSRVFLSICQLGREVKNSACLRDKGLNLFIMIDLV